MLTMANNELVSFKIKNINFNLFFQIKIFNSYTKAQLFNAFFIAKSYLAQNCLNMSLNKR